MAAPERGPDPDADARPAAGGDGSGGDGDSDADATADAPQRSQSEIFDDLVHGEPPSKPWPLETDAGTLDCTLHGLDRGERAPHLSSLDMEVGEDGARLAGYPDTDGIAAMTDLIVAALEHPELSESKTRLAVKNIDDEPFFDTFAAIMQLSSGVDDVEEFRR